MTSNITKGKIGEYFAIGMFLREGFQVYSVEADLYGIDFLCIPNNTDKILKIQVKSTTSLTKGFRIKRNQPEIDYYFFINTEDNRFWIMPYRRVCKKVRTIHCKSTIKDIILKYENSFFRGFEEFKILKHSIPKFDSNRIGKAGERIAASQLLKRGYQVFNCLSDDSGIDIIIIDKTKKAYNVQVKYSSKQNFRNISHIKNKKNTKFLLIANSGKKFYLCNSATIYSMIHNGNLYLSKGREFKNGIEKIVFV